jgi:hypothetical protein
MEATITETHLHQNPVLTADDFSSSASSLDSLETSIDSVLPACYNDLRFEKHREELSAAIEMYATLDATTSGHRTFDLTECHHYAWFTRHKITGQVKVQANSCRLRWCPVCAEAKQLRIRDAVSKWLKGFTKPRFITLTCSHSSDTLDVQIDNLYRSFRLLRTHKQISKKLRGGVWFFQLKRGKKDHCWHPHLHVLVDSDYINQKELSLEWLRTTGNSYIVDIRAVKDPGKVADYVSRYCAKPCRLSDFETSDRLEIATVLHGKRLCGTFGSGHQCSFKPVKPEDFAMWQRLGQWSYIVTDRFYKPVSREIIRCWSTGDALAEDVCRQNIIDNNPPEAPAYSTIEAVKAQQLRFENFMKR